MGAAERIAAPETRLIEAVGQLKAGRLAPYLGSGLVALTGSGVPSTPQALAAELGRKVPLPQRLRGNLWGAAQFIDQRKHRRTLDQLTREAFAVPLAPAPLHRALAELGPALIIDAWYDGAMVAALREAHADFAVIEGASKALEPLGPWTRAFDDTGAPVTEALAQTAPTLVYKPHGTIKPGHQPLIADSDYVEVLTEIDIQTPIPAAVKAHRAGMGFFFLGCRFDDQMLRTYARQLAKRSAGGHVAVVDLAALSRNERRFLAETGIEPIDLPLEVAAEVIVAELG